MDDMDGLELFDEIDGIGDLFDFDEWFSGEALMSDGIAALTGAGGILLASAGIPRIPLPDAWTPETKSRVRSLAGLVTAYVGGRLLWRLDRRASSAFVGAVGGMAIAQLVGGLANLSVGFAASPEEEALMGAEDELLGQGDEDMGRLSAAAVEATQRQFAGAGSSVSVGPVGNEFADYQPYNA